MQGFGFLLYHVYQFIVAILPKDLMDNPELMNWIAGGLGATLLICAFLMMFTTVFTKRSR
jgi:hypothetical protein